MILFLQIAGLAILALTGTILAYSITKYRQSR